MRNPYTMVQQWSWEGTALNKFETFSDIPSSMNPSDFDTRGIQDREVRYKAYKEKKHCDRSED